MMLEEMEEREILRNKRGRKEGEIDKESKERERKK